MERRTSLPPEFQLLLACAGGSPARENVAAIREMLSHLPDWTRLVQQAVNHDVTGPVGRTLAHIAPDLVTDEISNAFRATMQKNRLRNRALLSEVTKITDAFGENGVEVIAFNGPVFVSQAHGDLGLGSFQNLDFLVRPPDIVSAIKMLHRLGYERPKKLNDMQTDLIRDLQGHEILFNRSLGSSVAIYTRLTSRAMVLDIDYAGLWDRARPATLNGRAIMTLAPEDVLIVQAILGGQEMWRRMSAATSAAAFVDAHQDLDWSELLGRAKAQGCLRMILLMIALVRQFLGAMPDTPLTERRDRTIEPMVQRILAGWIAQDGAGRLAAEGISLDRLRLHAGAARRLRHMTLSLFLPGPYHVARVALPRRLYLAYIPIKIGHDMIARPLWRIYCSGLRQAKTARNALIVRTPGLAMILASPEARRELKRHETAGLTAKQALAADPEDVAALSNLGKALFGLKRYEEAIACYDRALAILPDVPGLWHDRDAALRAGKKTPLYQGEEPAPDSRNADAWVRHAGRLLAWQRYGEAAAASERALAASPRHPIATRIGIRSRLSACDWQRREDDKRQVTESIMAGRPSVTPFNHRTICDSEAESLSLAKLVARGFPRPEPLWRGEVYRHDKIRVAYLSGEFHDHPMTSVMAGVYDYHDKTRFETIAISAGAHSQSGMRRRLEAAFDRFIDVQGISDAEVAAMLREMEIDIAIDLNGHAGSGRTAILAYRPAPIQVNYLAYSGTMGASFFDYIIADRVVIPDENRVSYSERVVDLPDSYMPTDRHRPIAENIPIRAQAELPETGFVFACHNAEHKIGPDMFDIWMRLLLAIQGSVLWLKHPEPAAMGNLLRAAQSRGVAPERLIFAPRLPQMEDHLARLRLADLFLDTLPYNAHATACDALWAGLPVLTCMGKAFPGRVGASLLFAAGLPELVTSSLAEYEALALALAHNPARLAEIRAKLMRNRNTEPLFDTARFTRNLETAYTMMWQRAQRGEPPQSFSVPGSPHAADLLKA